MDGCEYRLEGELTTSRCHSQRGGKKTNTTRESTSYKSKFVDVGDPLTLLLLDRPSDRSTIIAATAEESFLPLSFPLSDQSHPSRFHGSDRSACLISLRLPYTIKLLRSRSGRFPMNQRWLRKWAFPKSVPHKDSPTPPPVVRPIHSFPSA